MEKKISKFALIALVSLFMFSSCSSDPKNDPTPPPPTSLDAPKNIVFNAQTFTFSWDIVKNAVGYQCASNNALEIGFAPIFKNNTAVLTNPVRDKWHTFYVRAVNGNVSSEISGFDFIITDKKVLDTPTGFSYEIIEKVGDKLKVKLSWSAVNNAVLYNCRQSTKFGDSIFSNGKDVSTTEMILPSVTVGSTIILHVRAVPAKDSSEYAPSKEGAAQIKEIK